MEKIKTEIEWYDNPNLLTNIILGVIIAIIVMSQAFAVNTDLSSSVMLRNLLNHNSTYIAALIYFIFLKTKVGRTNFNLINTIYILLYLLITVASVFTIFQSFGLSSIASLILNIMILSYMIYTFLPETRIWNDLSLDKVPFDEIKNDWYFYIIGVVSLFLLIVNLISATDFDGVVLTLFDTIYIILFSRYIYLYKKYQEDKLKIKEEDKNVFEDIKEEKTPPTEDNSTTIEKNDKPSNNIKNSDKPLKDNKNNKAKKTNKPKKKGEK